MNSAWIGVVGAIVGGILVGIANRYGQKRIEKKGFAAALRGELGAVRYYMDGMIRDPAKRWTGPDVWLRIDTTVYESSPTAIGYFKPREARHIAWLYSLFALYNDYIDQASKQPQITAVQSGELREFLQNPAHLPPEEKHDIVAHVDRAIEYLESVGGKALLSV